MLNKSLLMVYHSVPGVFLEFFLISNKMQSEPLEDFEQILFLSSAKDAGELNQMWTINAKTTVVDHSFTLGC